MTKQKNRNVWSWGFTQGAENWNGRLAMLGCIAAIITETITKYSILEFLGFIRG